MTAINNTNEENFIMQKTKEFIRTPMEQEYSFEVEEGYGKNTVHRMRVALSRLRKQVKADGKKIKQFKMILVSITKMEKQAEQLVAQEKVVLKKSQSGRQRIMEIIPELEATSNG